MDRGGLGPSPPRHANVTTMLRSGKIGLMSHEEAKLLAQRYARNGMAHGPRLALIAAIALVLALPLGLPPLAFVSIDILGAGGDGDTYPLRLDLPSAQVQQSQKLALVEASNSSVLEQEPSGNSPSRPSFDSSAFATAFSSSIFGDTKQQSKVPAAVQVEPGKFLSLNYDLATLEPSAERLDRSDGSLTVEKPLIVDGVSAGSATIRIEEGAKILISVSSVSKALGSKANSLPKRITGALDKGSGFIPFYELRGAGIAVEYDAAQDRVAMSMPS